MQGNNFTLTPLDSEEIDIYNIEFKGAELYNIESDFYDGYLPHETDKQKITDWLDKTCKKVENECIEGVVDEYLTLTNGIAQHMAMDREVIAQSAIWKGKKMYACSVLDNEGYRYEKPNLKIMGLSAKKATTQQHWRDHLSEMIRILLEEDEDTFQKYYADVKADYMQSNPTDIAQNIGVKNITKYEHDSIIYHNPNGGVPMNSRAAILYNHYIKKHGINDRYPEIHEGDKIKFIKLSTPNPIQENVIGFYEELPEEFGLDNYVDWNANFDKDVKSPIEELATIAGYKLEKTRNIFDFM